MAGNTDNTFANITKHRVSPDAEGVVTVSSGDTFRHIYMLGQEALPPAIFIEENAVANILVMVLPGVSANVGMEVILRGKNAVLEMSGAYILGSDEKLNLDIDVFHDMPSCYSRQLFKGIVGGNAKADFYGKVIVAPDAQKTEAYQENHNILLSDTAQVNARPQLEIYADDVKCTHGATIGRLNEEEQFYMRSRGITLEEARALQIISFLSPVLSSLDENLHDGLASRLEGAVMQILK